MLFSSLTFLYLFLPILFVSYFICRRSGIRKAVLVIFSLIFYAWGEPIYIFLMLLTIFANYLFGKMIGTTSLMRNKKMLLALGISINLLFLAYFKYSGFIIDIINLAPIINLPRSNVKLPLGISFYTFQAMTYIIDVYRGDCKWQKNFFSLLLYVSFFSQLIAGPIVKYKDIEAELEDRKSNIEDIYSGAFRFAVGLGKKVLLANHLGKVSDLLLLNVENYTQLTIWVGLIFFLLQLYFDFAGYSDMAIGLGRIFGFHYKENFDYPYISKSIQEFWRRWHISLGTFFREYVYIPLGGKYRHQVRNILLVWMLTGLWHGASINFVLWGLYFAAILIIEKVFLLKVFEKIPKTISRILGHIYFLYLIVVGIVLFYFEDLNKIKYIYKSMFVPNAITFSNAISNSIVRENIILLFVAIIASTPIIKKVSINVESRLSGNIVILTKTFLIISLLFFSTMSILGDSYNPFLYFRF